MSGKTARRLRRESRYHPKNPRKYHWENVKCLRQLKNGQSVTIERSILMLNDDESRILYKELKREYYQGVL